LEKHNVRKLKMQLNLFLKTIEEKDKEHYKALCDSLNDK
jgi:hypothetical protein